MAVAPEVEQCVVFLARMCRDGERLTGTAFFIDERVDGVRFEYLVTARHVIDKIRDHGRDGCSYVRLNLRGRGLSTAKADLGHWIFHDDPRVDVAVLPVGWTEKDEHVSVNTGSFVTDELLRTIHSIRVGTQIYFPGLFYRHAGTTQILPIMRFGNIAGMNVEPIQTKLGPIDAYLIEARSIGGLSGSPVFVDFGLHLQHTYLLGLVHGHYGVRDIPDSQADDDSLSFPSEKEERSVNMGIGMAIPAKYILEVLNQPELVATKKRDAAKRLAMRLDRD